MSKQKPIVAMDISTSGKGGGPYTSTMNLVNSSLKEKYDYRIFEYNTSLGRFISIKRIKDLVRQLREINPDIVHFTGLQLSGFHIAVACRLAGLKRTVIVIRGSSTEALTISFLQRIIIYMLEVATLAMVKTFYGVSKYSSELRLTKPFRKRSSGWVYNLPIMTQKSDSPFSKSDLGFSENDVVVVSVARITTDKGYHILCQAIKNLVDKPTIKFLIVGSGAYLSTMENELAGQSEQVKFLGYRSDVSRILPACDIFVLPTLHETLSNSLLEASEYCLPLVASDVGGVPEIITSGENGLLVPPSDPDAIRDAIVRISENETLRKEMGSRAKEILGEKFSEKSISEKVNSIYKNLLGE